MSVIVLFMVLKMAGLHLYQDGTIGVFIRPSEPARAVISNLNFEGM